MGHSTRRKYLIDEPDVKEWKNADEITLWYLNRHENATFGVLLSYVNQELGDKKYSRKGYSLRLDVLVDDGLMGRRPHKQGHFLYHITRKGEKNLELISIIFRTFSKGLLNSHFLNEKNESKENHVETIVQRMGIYMLSSCIHGVLQYTSPERNHKDNVANMKSWINGMNPGVELINHLGDITSHFVKFASEQEALAPMFTDKNRLEILEDFQKILKKKYPQECEFLDERKQYIAGDIKEAKKTKTQSYKKKIKEILED